MKELNAEQIKKLRDGLQEVVRSRNLGNLTSVSGVAQHVIFVADVDNIQELISKAENIIANFFDGKELVIKEVAVIFRLYPMFHYIIIRYRGKR